MVWVCGMTVNLWILYVARGTKDGWSGDLLHLNGPSLLPWTHFFNTSINLPPHQIEAHDFVVYMAQDVMILIGRIHKFTFSPHHPPPSNCAWSPASHRRDPVGSSWFQVSDGSLCSFILVIPGGSWWFLIVLVDLGVAGGSWWFPVVLVDLGVSGGSWWFPVVLVVPCSPYDFWWFLVVPGCLVVPSASCGFELHWWSLVVPGGSRWSWWFLVIYCDPFHSWWFLVIPGLFLVLGHRGSWLVLCNFSGVFLEYKQCAGGGGGGRKKKTCTFGF